MRSSISRRRRLSRRWSTTWCRPTISRRRAPISASTSISIARSPARWGKGERLYMQGPWKPGVPSQGYQLPLTPAQLYRAGIEATNAHCRKTYGKTFDRLAAQPARGGAASGLSTGKLTFENGLPARTFWTTRLSDRDGGDVLGPDLRRQSQQGGLEADRLSRARSRCIARTSRNTSDKKLPDESRRHRGHELTGTVDMAQRTTQGSRCRHRRSGLDRRHHGEGACRGGAEGRRARARRRPLDRQGLCGSQHPRRTALTSCATT